MSITFSGSIVYGTRKNFRDVIRIIFVILYPENHASLAGYLKRLQLYEFGWNFLD